jgi:excisionase family DNA binding protein
MNAADRVLEMTPPRMAERDADMARVAERLIMKALDRSRAAAITLTLDRGKQTAIEVPPSALKLIGQLLGAIADGRPITVLPSRREFTTVEAAHFLNVSRPFVVKEIEEGRLPHRMVGTHRRIALEDLLAYARKMREKQTAALERMAENARELGLRY